MDTDGFEMLLGIQASRTFGGCFVESTVSLIPVPGRCCFLKDEMNPKRVSGSYSHMGIHSIRGIGPLLYKGHLVPKVTVIVIGGADIALVVVPVLSSCSSSSSSLSSISLSLPTTTTNNNKCSLGVD